MSTRASRLPTNVASAECPALVPEVASARIGTGTDPQPKVAFPSPCDELPQEPEKIPVDGLQLGPLGGISLGRFSLPDGLSQGRLF